MSYQLVFDALYNRNVSVFRLDDCIYIPFDPANTDYQEYLAWLAEGNEPLPADD